MNRQTALGAEIGLGCGSATRVLDTHIILMQYSFPEARRASSKAPVVLEGRIENEEYFDGNLPRNDAADR
jgi:hypothetical protein